MGTKRSLERGALRASYLRFREAWRHEKRFQAFTLGGGGSLPKGVNQLGRAPTFAMWKRALDNGAIRRREEAPPPPDKSVPVESTSWDDDDGSL